MKNPDSEQEPALAWSLHRIAVAHNRAALIDHLRLMRGNVTLVPGADLKSYPDGWKAAIDEVMKNIPIP